MIKGNKYTLKTDYVILHIKETNVLIDIEDYDIVSSYTWYISTNGYIVSSSLRKKTGKLVHLHRLVVNCPTDKVVDHINHNKLDNRKSNLRICTLQQNSINSRRFNNNSTTSKYRGVTYCKNTNKWRAKTKYKGKTISLGYFDTQEEGAIAYNRYMKEHFKDFAKFNIIEDL